MLRFTRFCTSNSGCNCGFLRIFGWLLRSCFFNRLRFSFLLRFTRFCTSNSGCNCGFLRIFCWLLRSCFFNRLRFSFLSRFTRFCTSNSSSDRGFLRIFGWLLRSRFFNRLRFSFLLRFARFCTSNSSGYCSFFIFWLFRCVFFLLSFFRFRARDCCSNCGLFIISIVSRGFALFFFCFTFTSKTLALFTQFCHFGVVRLSCTNFCCCGLLRFCFGNGSRDSRFNCWLSFIIFVRFLCFNTSNGCGDRIITTG